MTTYTTTKITKMSLPTLQLKQSEAEIKLQELRNEIISEAIIKNELLKIQNAKSELVKINQEISSQRERREVSAGWMGAIFKTQVMPQSAIDNIEEAKKKIKINEEIIYKSEAIVRNQEHIKKRIAKGAMWLDSVNSRIKTIENKEAKLQSLKNKAAESIKTKRVIAKGIKRSLADNDDCPYCGFVIVGAIHADHIYPVSKGGESTKKNMVLVCADCNSKKSALTLQAFIKKHNLNRDEIENRLSSLGKDF
jgi:5-methylcytosine-specific restriction endonuclease McrA